MKTKIYNVVIIDESASMTPLTDLEPVVDADEDGIGMVTIITVCMMPMDKEFASLPKAERSARRKSFFDKSNDL